MKASAARRADRKYGPTNLQGTIPSPVFPEGFFESAKVLLEAIISGSLHEGFERVATVFLCRHYLELALKYTLYHSRWLNDETHNAGDDVEPVGQSHDLQKLWEKLSTELDRRVPSIWAAGYDLDFVAGFVKEFHEVDGHNTRFRYPGKQLPVVPSPNETLHTLDRTTRREPRMARIPG